MERIDKVEYLTNTPGTSLFLDGPTEFLCKSIAEQLKLIEEWKAIFGDNIDGYKRMDYPIRAVPALRIYNNNFAKDFESWFIEGEVVMDAIFPASLRRRDLQQIPDSLTAALLQQFRRPTFFSELTQKVPGLNELGKRFNVDKSLAFEMGEELLPLTQISVNFRLDLREWDQHLEDTYRTKDSPFKVALGDLKRVVALIQGLRDDEETQVEVELDQTPGGG